MVIFTGGSELCFVRIFFFSCTISVSTTLRQWGSHYHFLFAYFLPWTSHKQLLMSVIRSRQILIFVPKSEFTVINWNILNFLIGRAYEDYKKAFYAGDDGRPDWIARKSWNYMIATVEVSKFEFHILLFSTGHLSQTDLTPWIHIK